MAEQPPDPAPHWSERPESLSPLEALPDAVLQNIVELIGLRDAYGVCSLRDVSRRVREVVEGAEWPELALRADPEEEDVRWDRRPRQSLHIFEVSKLLWRISRSGGVRLGTLVVDIPSCGHSDLSYSYELNFWLRKSGYRPSYRWIDNDSDRPAMILAACLSKLRGLRSVHIRHCAPLERGPTYDERRADPRDRREYVLALLKALAPCRETLEELAIGFTHAKPVRCPAGCALLPVRCSPAARLSARAGDDDEWKPLLAALRPFQSLRLLDLSGYCFSAQPILEEPEVGFLAKLARALPRLRSLGLRAGSGGRINGVDGYAAAMSLLLAPNFPLLEELSLRGYASRCGRDFLDERGWDDLRDLCSLPHLRSLRLDLRALDDLDATSVDVFELVAEGAAARPHAGAPLERLAAAWRVVWEMSEENVAALCRLTSLQSLALGLDPARLRGGYLSFTDRGALRALGGLPALRRLRSLSLGLCLYEAGTGPAAVQALAALPSLETLALSLAAPVEQAGQEEAAAAVQRETLAALAGAVPAMHTRALRSLSLVLDGEEGDPGERAALFTAAAPVLERLVLRLSYPRTAPGEVAALARCRRLQSLRLRLSFPAGPDPPPGAEVAALLAPLAALPPLPPHARPHSVELDLAACRPHVEPRLWRYAAPEAVSAMLLPIRHGHQRLLGGIHVYARTAPEHLERRCEVERAVRDPELRRRTPFRPYPDSDSDPDVDSDDEYE
eukprot:tig00000769_g4041.t1